MVLVNSADHQSQALRRRVKRYGKIGGIMAGIGGFITIGFPMLISAGMSSQMVIKEGNEITKAWMDVPLPITNKIWVWHIENPQEFRRGAKAKLKELGPYTWVQHRWKEIISWGRNQESVKFWAISSWQFDPERSVGTRDDKITVVNVPVYAMAAVVKGLVDKLPLSFAIAPVAFGFVNVLFMTHGEGLLKELTVGQLVEGYPFGILDTVDTLTRPLTWLGIKLPDNGMPQNKFGLLHVKNFTKGGPYEVYTGQQGTKFLKFISFQGKRNLDFYDDPRCNLMNGSDGTTMGSFLTKKDILYVFNGDACRSIYATYKERSSVKGMPTWRYVLPKEMFAGPNSNPDNMCFCTTRDDFEKCDGIFDLGPCQMGAPLAFSYPHLMYASQKIRDGVEGMNPDLEKHESFFDVEPTLGIPMKGAGRLQVNLLMKPMPLLVGFGGVREAVLPFVWLEEMAALDGTFALMMQAAVYPMLAIDYGSFFALLGGLGVLGYTSYMSLKNRKILFPPKPEKNGFNPMETQAKEPTKGNSYPSSERMVVNGDNPPVYTISQMPFNKTQSGTQTMQMNGIDNTHQHPNQQRVSWSPPGATE